MSKPIDTSKYPLIKQCSDLVRNIDALPASTEATNLVIKAGALMDDVWKYLEEQDAVRSKMTLANLIKTQLESQYLGKKIRTYNKYTFVVENIEVSDDLSESYMKIAFSTIAYKEAGRVWNDWQIKNANGSKIPPRDVEGPWIEASNQCYTMIQINDRLPEIME